MNIYIKILMISVILTLVQSSLQSQSPGLVIQTGLTTAYSKDEAITKNGETHSGWMIGADARILEGNMYFIIGAQYHQTSLGSTASPQFFKNDWTLVHGRCGLGFNVFRLSEKLTFRTKILGSVNFLIDAPSKALNIPGYTEINDSSLGAVTGIGITLGSIDLDLEYQYGIINAYRFQPKSTFDVWTLMAGFHF